MLRSAARDSVDIATDSTVCATELSASQLQGCLMMSRLLLVLLAILCLRNASAGDPDENGQRSKEPVAEKLIGSDTESRFLAPEALEGLGRLFMLSGELASCYTCSVSFPMHAQSCCSSGYTSCCLNGNFFGKICSIHFSKILNEIFGRRFQLRRIRLPRRTLRLQSSWNLPRSRSQLPSNVHQSMFLRFRLSWRVQVLLFRMQLHLFQALGPR